MHDHGFKPQAIGLVVFLLHSALASPMPPRPQISGTAKSSSTPAYANESSVIQSIRTVVNFAADGTATREETAQIRVQSEGGIEEWGLLSFAFNSANQRVEIGYVRVVKPDGSMFTTPSVDVQDVTAEVTSEAPMYSDYREKHVPVRGLAAGDVLEYQVTTRDYKPLVPGQFWFSFDFDKEHVVLGQELEVRVPKQSDVSVKSPDFKPTLDEKGDQRVYAWKTANSGHKDEDFSPDVPPPAIQISTFKSWEEVGRWWGALEQTQAAVTPEIRARAVELTKGATTDEERLDAIYSYVATKFRYVSISFGIGRYQPHAAAEVLRNAYGDCKDKQTLLTALLAAADIPSYPALVNSFRKIDPDVPSPGQFDHVIGVVPRGETWRWADTTSEVAPLGFLTLNLRDKEALVIPLSENPSLVKTPATPPFAEFQTIDLEGKLGDNGTLECKVQRTARGDAELGLRGEFRRTPQARWKGIAHAFAYGSSFGGEASDVTATAPEATGTPFSYSYRFKGQDASDWTYKRLLIQVPALALPASVKETQERQYPVELGAPREVSIHLKIEMPVGYTPKLLPPVDVSRGFAEYHSACAFKDGVLTCQRRLVVKAKEVPLSGLEEYRAFHKTVTEDMLAYTYLLTGAESVATLPPNPEAARMVGEAREAIERQDLKGAVELLERVVKTDPQYPAGWLSLGYVQFTLGRREESVTAFRQAVELVPKDLTARKALAVALSGDKPDESIQAWQQVLKLDRNDRQAHAALGEILLRQKQYGEAAAELEAAAALTTPTSSLQEKVADAYFGAGNDAKAVAALAKAVDLDPNPRTWNHIASLLAKHNQGLGEAQQFAEKAVSAEEHNAAKTSLENVEVDDVQRVANLADYWDTLGWVYFRQGKTAQAERYLRAAWDLAPAGVIGEHLGQAYEKQGKKDAAIAAYSLGLAGPSSDREEREEMYSRLLVLIKNQATVDATLKLARRDAARQHTANLGLLSTKAGSAEFWLLLGRDGGVEDIKFISGLESFRALGKVIVSLKFKTPFPDDTPLKLLRRGVLVCVGEGHSCDFTLQDPRTVHVEMRVIHSVK